VGEKMARLGKPTAEGKKKMECGDGSERGGGGGGGCQEGRGEAKMAMEGQCHPIHTFLWAMATLLRASTDDAVAPLVFV
jgi:hypothetical protein